MKSLLKFLLGGILCFSLSVSFSQQTGLSTQVLYFPAVSCLGCQDTFVVRIKNMDNIPYSGFINIYVSHDTSAFSVASLCVDQMDSINSLDSIQHTCNITFDSTYFGTGNNIVVVWSSGNAKAPADTAWTNVFLNPAGIHEISNLLSFSLVPTITNSFINVELSKPEMPLEKIRILDIFGREINSITLAKREKKNLVDVSSLPSGVYFLEVSSGNLRNTRKFVKID